MGLFHRKRRRGWRKIWGLGSRHKVRDAASSGVCRVSGTRCRRRTTVGLILPGVREVGNRWGRRC
jgi:hypothetical protein